jgi:hypothetical protein
MGDAVNQPAHGDGLHPGSDEGHALAKEEQPIIAVVQGAKNLS